MQGHGVREHDEADDALVELLKGYGVHEISLATVIELCRDMSQQELALTIVQALSTRDMRPPSGTADIIPIDRFALGSGNI